VRAAYITVLDVFLSPLVCVSLVTRSNYRFFAG
jgi:hypothetical protein